MFRITQSLLTQSLQIDLKNFKPKSLIVFAGLSEESFRKALILSLTRSFTASKSSITLSSLESPCKEHRVAVGLVTSVPALIGAIPEPCILGRVLAGRPDVIASRLAEYRLFV